MDKKSLKILKMFYYHEFLSCDMISAVLECDVNSVMEMCLFLRNLSYISTSDITQTNENEIYPDSPYRITIQGKSAYEKDEAEKQKHKQQARRDWKIALVSSLLGGIFGFLSSLAFWLITTHFN